MGKLYIFAIGGTGSRVLRSLTHLLASGVCINVDSIVPIIVDPDDSAGNLTPTVDLMRNYSKVRSELKYDNTTSNGFFSKEITELLPGFRMSIANTQNLKFKDFVEVSSLDKANQALARMLFSEKNLEADMQVGFKGNPNIGSVVLNRFVSSAQFTKFADDFKQGDRIFVISSIFGGTGASGFPVLVKCLRSLPGYINNATLIQNAPIGAVTVLPYFGIATDDESEIDQSTFISKTKAALSYYEKNMQSLDSIYYIGDKILSQYENNEGGVTQKNDAHIIELIAALGIIDFVTEFNDRQPSMVSKEFGIRDLSNESEDLTMQSFEDDTYDLIARPLTQFTMFAKYNDERLRESVSSKQVWTKTFEEKKFFGSRFKRDLESVQSDYMAWLKEMDGNKRGFSPFVLDKNPNAVFDLVRGAETKRVFSTKSNYDLFDHYLNKREGDNKSEKMEQKLIELFYKVTSELIEDKIKL